MEMRPKQSILGSTGPRWCEHAERCGQLTVPYLGLSIDRCNVYFRLSRFASSTGQVYDTDGGWQLYYHRTFFSLSIVFTSSYLVNRLGLNSCSCVSPGMLVCHGRSRNKIDQVDTKIHGRSLAIFCCQGEFSRHTVDGSDCMYVPR